MKACLRISLLASLISIITGVGMPNAYAQNINVLASASNTFTFSNCVSNICISNVQVFQQTVKEYIPAQMVWAGGGSSGVGSFGGTTIPARWDQYPRTIISANVVFPRCPNQYHLEGFLTVYYRNADAYITRTHQIQRSDESQTRNLTWNARGYYGQPSNGRIQVKASTTCRWHGVNNSGLPF